MSYCRTFWPTSHWPYPTAGEVGKCSLHCVVQNEAFPLICSHTRSGVCSSSAKPSSRNVASSLALGYNPSTIRPCKDPGCQEAQAVPQGLNRFEYCVRPVPGPCQSLGSAARGAVQLTQVWWATSPSLVTAWLGPSPLSPISCGSELLRG